MKVQNIGQPQLEVMCVTGGDINVTPSHDRIQLLTPAGTHFIDL